MGERWWDPARTGLKNLVESRVISEAIEREWLMDLLSSLGQERAGSDALLARMRERRTIALRKAIPPVAFQKGGQRRKSGE
jgi:hypothetical protein